MDTSTLESGSKANFSRLKSKTLEQAYQRKTRRSSLGCSVSSKNQRCTIKMELVWVQPFQNRSWSNMRATSLLSRKREKALHSRSSSRYTLKKIQTIMRIKAKSKWFHSSNPTQKILFLSGSQKFLIMTSNMSPIGIKV